MADFEDQFTDSAGSSRRDLPRFNRTGIALPLGEAVRRALRGEDFKNRLISPVLSADAGKPSCETLRDVEGQVFDALCSFGNLNVAEFLDARIVEKSLKIEILQAVARRLGDAWVCDDGNFVLVTLATARLQLALHQISQKLASQTQRDPGPSALIIIPRREQHRFGASIVEELFRIRGWTASTLICDEGGEIGHAVASTGARVVCLAWSSSCLNAEAEEALEAIQLARKSRDLLVLAGGAASEEKVQWLYQRGVDNICADAYLAIEYAERHVQNQTIAKAGFASTQLSRELSAIA